MPLITDFPNIIFDLGGVILNIDYHLTTQAFRKLGVHDFEKNYTQLGQSALFDAMERGEITNADFRNQLRQALSISANDSDLDHAWNAMLLDLPAQRLQVLAKLKESKRTFLLSNTNHIHVDSFEQTVKHSHGINDLSSLFEQTYYSCNVGMRKPEERIFRLVVDQNGLNLAETLFIDDSPQHIHGARAAGLQAYHLTGGETINDLFGHIS
jgi:FMN phosphatase YigB (HAD superfamily)